MSTEIFNFDFNIGGEENGFKVFNLTSKIRVSDMFIFHFLSNCYLSATNHFALLQIVDCLTSIWVSRLLFIGRKNYKVEGIPSLIFHWKKLVNRRSYLGQDFLGKVNNFEPQFISPQKSKWKNFSTY